MDVISILLKKRQDVTAYDVEVTGERVEDHPRKFTKFHVHHIVHGRNVSEQAVARRCRAFGPKILLRRRDRPPRGRDHDKLRDS